MPTAKPTPSPESWDIFCRVVDNFGDIGVCWRLAKQLATEHSIPVRLWIDELKALRQINPMCATDLASQTIDGIQVQYWPPDFPETTPGAVVIEAFACRLPESYLRAMARMDRPPVWIVLDYLSAEAWVSGCHALPSPHPHLPLTAWFYFPGFVETTGGLLRERALDEERTAFLASSQEQAQFWRSVHQCPPPTDGLRVSLFAYENPALPILLDTWATGGTPIVCLAPITRTQAALEQFAGRALSAGDIVRRGALEIRVLPFVRQEVYDRLLWSCDINFVRGEDSFVRAQWAERPLLWHIYPQEEDAHRAKLDAFLHHYGAELPPQLSTLLNEIMLAWNGFRPFSAALVEDWGKQLPALKAHAQRWANHLKKQEDLCSSLVRFCRSKL